MNFREKLYLAAFLGVLFRIFFGETVFQLNITWVDYTVASIYLLILLYRFLFRNREDDVEY